MSDTNKSTDPEIEQEAERMLSQVITEQRGLMTVTSLKPLLRELATLRAIGERAAKPTAADRRLAAKIASELFVNHLGRAQRLVLEHPGMERKEAQCCGGWSEQSMADYIATILSAARVEQRKRKGKG